MSLFSVSLRPRGAFHLGERGIGYEETSEFVRADSLFGALCSVWALVYGPDAVARDLLPDGSDGWEPPFLLASAFPRAGSVRFYPRPLLPPPEPHLRWKDVEWVSEAVFSAWLASGPLPELEEAHGGAVVLSRDEADRLRRECSAFAEGLPLWKAQRVPRVTLDATSQASELWHFGRLWFAPGCGLHFWVDLRRLEDRFWTALRVLGDVGLGGDRSAGHGLFEADFRKEEPAWPESESRFVTLAPVHPKPEQVRTLLGDGCAYRLVTRTGWIGSALATPYRRKAVRMLAEGSVLVGSSRAVWGQLVDTTPEVPDLPHRVYRWGYAFCAGVSKT
jgi:CRISPR-associated protein Csm4